MKLNLERTKQLQPPRHAEVMRVRVPKSTTLCLTHKLMFRVRLLLLSVNSVYKVLLT